MSKKTLSIYIHIPFCVKKCLYCDFLSASAGEEEQQRYLSALLKEISEECMSYVNCQVSTVFIGGGTPSVLPGEAIIQIMQTLRESYEFREDCEISMEVNPGTVTKEKAMLWKKAGINRISIGLQSAVDAELQALGRIHNISDFMSTYELIVKTGFNNINVDLMSAIPFQTIESYRETLKLVTGLKPCPNHISAYSLIIEEGTPFYEAQEKLVLPDEDTEREMYKITDEFLSGCGYDRYEISNYARPGYECRHNQVYWRRGDYVGFGLGSASMVNNVRFHNCSDIESYVNHYESGDTHCHAASVKEDVHKLTVEEQMEEFMFLGLRMMEGVSDRRFVESFGRTIDEVYPGVVDKFVNMGLLFREKFGEDERIALTGEGIHVSNRIMAEFLLS